MSSFATTRYKLRAGAPMPTSSAGNFVLHTFMAVTNDVVIETCTSSLPSSSEFQGQGGNLSSASFSQLPIKGGNDFKGTTVNKDTYVEEG